LRTIPAVKVDDINFVGPASALVLKVNNSEEASWKGYSGELFQGLAKQFEKSKIETTLKNKLNSQIANMEAFNEPYNCMNFFAAHRPIPDGDGLIVELGAQNSCGNGEKIKTHKNMPQFSGWEVGTDIHLMHDIIESWFETFVESYRFTQYYERDLITVEFDPTGRPTLDFD